MDSNKLKEQIESIRSAVSGVLSEQVFIDVDYGDDLSMIRVLIGNPTSKDKWMFKRQVSTASLDDTEGTAKYIVETYGIEHLNKQLRSISKTERKGQVMIAIASNLKKGPMLATDLLSTINVKRVKDGKKAVHRQNFYTRVSIMAKDGYLIKSEASYDNPLVIRLTAKGKQLLQ